MKHFQNLETFLVSVPMWNSNSGTSYFRLYSKVQFKQEMFESFESTLYKFLMVSGFSNINLKSKFSNNFPTQSVLKLYHSQNDSRPFEKQSWLLSQN